eukprot:712848-Prorocentrum_minimum.AAC.1
MDGWKNSYTVHLVRPQVVKTPLGLSGAPIKKPQDTVPTFNTSQTRPLLRFTGPPVPITARVLLSTPQIIHRKRYSNDNTDSYYWG